MMLDYLTYAVLALLVIVFLTQAIRILREYERGVVFTLGRFTGVKGPGLIILIPVVQQLVKVDLRVMVQVVPPQDVISRDNVSVKVNAVLYFRIVDPERSIIKVGDYMARPASSHKPRFARCSVSTNSTRCSRNVIG
jgi:regulator of protease activity HflC (stomatin/prohibitin superfamily)